MKEEIFNGGTLKAINNEVIKIDEIKNGIANSTFCFYKPNFDFFTKITETGRKTDIKKCDVIFYGGIIFNVDTGLIIKAVCNYKAYDRYNQKTYLSHPQFIYQVDNIKISQLFLDNGNIILPKAIAFHSLTWRWIIINLSNLLTNQDSIRWYSEMSRFNNVTFEYLEEITDIQNTEKQIAHQLSCMYILKDGLDNIADKTLKGLNNVAESITFASKIIAWEKDGFGKITS